MMWLFRKKDRDYEEARAENVAAQRELDAAAKRLSTLHDELVQHLVEEPVMERRKNVPPSE